jgi:hypothetical protein
MVAGDTSKKNVENIQTRIAEKRLMSTGKPELLVTCLIVYEQVEALAALYCHWVTYLLPSKSSLDTRENCSISQRREYNDVFTYLTLLPVHP